MRLSVNLSSLTIEQVVNKLQRSHLELIGLLTDALRFAGAPQRSLTTLEGLRTDAMRKDAEWFLEPRNFKQATDAALLAQQKCYESLPLAETWGGGADAGSVGRLLR